MLESLNSIDRLERQIARWLPIPQRQIARAEPGIEEPTGAPLVEEWIAREVTIEDPQSDGTHAIVPFDLWPAQREVLRTLATERQVIVLKARQLGLSWLAIALALWLCLHHPFRTVLVFSKDQDSANEIVRRAKSIYDRLARKVTPLAIDNVTQIGWANGSRIKSFAATEDAGTTFTASLTLIEEFAKMRYADSLYTAVKPTINDGGRIIIISTAKGEGNPFHRLWSGAVAGRNHLKPVFMPWDARPGRDAAWYARAEADAISSAAHRQEYPAQPDDAFTNLGEEAFLPSPIWWDNCREDLPALTRRDTLMLAGDAASVSDSFGLVGVTGHPTRRGHYAVRYAREWKPIGGIIDFYAPDGPDAEIRRLCREYNVAQFVYDPTEMRQLALKLSNDGVVYCHEFPQQAQRLEADKALLDAILARAIAHDGDEALRAHILNANRKPEKDDKSDLHRLRIVKRSAERKIDLAVALSMAHFSASILGL